MTKDTFPYTREQFRTALAETVKKILVQPNVKPAQKPYAFLLGGQSGAGKSTLHAILKERFHNDVIVINGDEYRKSHPHFNEIQRQFGMDAPAHTAKWSGAMTEALIDAFSAQHYNLIIEGTLRTSTVPLATAKLLRERGYGASLAIMAVKPEISLVSCRIRYEMMRIAGTTPRATDPEHHNKIVHDIVDNLNDLEQSGLFDEVLLYDRAGTQLYPRKESVEPIGADEKRQGRKPRQEEQPRQEQCQPQEEQHRARLAGDALRSILFGPWTAEETEHYEALKEQLEVLRGQ